MHLKPTSSLFFQQIRDDLEKFRSNPNAKLVYSGKSTSIDSAKKTLFESRAAKGNLLDKLSGRRHRDDAKVGFMLKGAIDQMRGDWAGTKEFDEVDARLNKLTSPPKVLNTRLGRLVYTRTIKAQDAMAVMDKLNEIDLNNRQAPLEAELRALKQAVKDEFAIEGRKDSLARELLQAELAPEKDALIGDFFRFVRAGQGSPAGNNPYRRRNGDFCVLWRDLVDRKPELSARYSSVHKLVEHMRPELVKRYPELKYRQMHRSELSREVGSFVRSLCLEESFDNCIEYTKATFLEEKVSADVVIGAIDTFASKVKSQQVAVGGRPDSSEREFCLLWAHAKKKMKFDGMPGPMRHTFSRIDELAGLLSAQFNRDESDRFMHEFKRRLKPV